jgi:hypothetical protein
MIYYTNDKTSKSSTTSYVKKFKHKCDQLRACKLYFGFLVLNHDLDIHCILARR